MSRLIELAERCEAAGGADREIDLAIALTTDFDDRIAKLVARARHGLDCEPGEAWELSDKHVLYAVWNEHCCYANGGYLLPAFTSSLDAAMSLAGSEAVSVLLNAIHDCQEDTVSAWVKELPRFVAAAALRALATKDKAHD